MSLRGGDCYSLCLPTFKARKKMHIFTCSLDRTTFGMSPSRFAMFTLAPCVINSFAIWSISRPLAVWSGVFPANVTLFTSAPRDSKYSATWYFPASTAWCKGVRPLLESYVFGRHRLIINWSEMVMNWRGSFFHFLFFFLALTENLSVNVLFSKLVNSFFSTEANLWGALS